MYVLLGSLREYRRQQRDPETTRRQIAVAVETTIADCLPRGSARALLCERLLAWMCGRKARIGIRVQNTWRCPVDLSIAGPRRVLGDPSREAPSTSAHPRFIGQSTQRMIPCARPVAACPRGKKASKANAGRPVHVHISPYLFSNLILLLLPASTVVSRRGLPQPSCKHEDGGGENLWPWWMCFDRFAPFSACTQAAVAPEALHFQ